MRPNAGSRRIQDSVPRESYFFAVDCAEHQRLHNWLAVEASSLAQPPASLVTAEGAAVVRHTFERPGRKRSSGALEDGTAVFGTGVQISEKPKSSPLGGGEPQGTRTRSRCARTTAAKCQNREWNRFWVDGVELSDSFSRLCLECLAWRLKA